MNQICEWLLVAASLIGVYLNINKRPECFYVWGLVAIAWAIVDFTHGIYSQAFLQVVYFGAAVWGWWVWRFQCVSG